ncbi:hypothetical protein [Janthinobacterium sp. JC611]|uniref:hypothetical protein n=1 Tax=Janthinobacterium sp. JC611 TaxID=2816201 RepID=UPI001BFDED83|nr:hypothetical protein [Janthinobacterium sp. JC611]
MNARPDIGFQIDPGGRQILGQSIDLETDLETDAFPHRASRAIVGINVADKKGIAARIEFTKNLLVDAIERILALGQQLQADAATCGRKCSWQIRQLRFQHIETGLIKK